MNIYSRIKLGSRFAKILSFALLSSLYLAFAWTVSVQNVLADADYCETFPDDPSCDSGSYCDLNDWDPACGGDPCESGNPPDYCSDPCLGSNPPAECSDPCLGSNPPPECSDPCLGSNPPPECTDPCMGDNPPPECYDPCEGDNPPPECTDPCDAENPPPECINLYCDDGGFCNEYADPVPCNYDPTGANVADPKQGSSSVCDCSCKEMQYFCNDPVYCDGDEPTNYDPSKQGQPGWEEDNSTCACAPKYFCNGASYCDGAPACNYMPEKYGVNPWQEDNSICECQDYCPDSEDPNYVDPSSLTCPRADYGLCEVTRGCKDSNAFNYDPDVDEHDQSMCVYLRSTACQYEVEFEVNKLNSQTGNIRNYAVGVLQIVVVSYFSDDPEALPPSCPALDVSEFTASHYAFIYDFLFPNWPSFEYGTTYYSNLGESEDFCTNIEGIQNEIPPGYVKNGQDCVPENTCLSLGCMIVDGEICDCEDMCPNISGVQTTIPAGYYLNDVGECVTGQECTDNGCSLVGGVCRCPVNGSCAAYSPDPSGPEPSGLLCLAGSPSSLTADETQWQYSCLGVYGGSDDACLVDKLCTGANPKYCATNAVASQCIPTNQCCDGFVMCPNGQCRPGTLANCNDIDLQCDETVSPPLCSKDGMLINGLDMTPPVSDIDTNSCAISWSVEAAGGSVLCSITREGASVQSYSATTIDRSYEHDVTPGRYDVTCERQTTETVTDSEGNESTYVLRVSDTQSASCVQNPNYSEF